MKSYSERTKSELIKYENTSSGCDMAEFAGMLLLGCVISKNEIKFITENPEVGSKFSALCKKLGYSAEDAGAKNAVRCVIQITEPTCL